MEVMWAQFKAACKSIADRLCLAHLHLAHLQVLAYRAMALLGAICAVREASQPPWDALHNCFEQSIPADFESNAVSFVR